MARNPSMKDVDKALRGIPTLYGSEREYVKGLLVQYRSNGISKTELKRAISELKSNTKDPIERAEADRIKKRLLELFS